MKALLLIPLLVFGLAGMAGAQNRRDRPNPKLTPGHALNVTADDLCKPGHAEIDGKVSVQEKSHVFDRYGIRGDLIGYNVDHLIPPELGGSNSLKNLWPQPLAGEWTNRMKNRLEGRLHKLVCSGVLDLRIAQEEIATDWIGAYKKYVEPTRPQGDRARARTSAVLQRRRAPARDQVCVREEVVGRWEMLFIHGRELFNLVVLTLLFGSYALLALVLLARAFVGLVGHRQNDAGAPTEEEEDVMLNDDLSAIRLRFEGIPLYGSVSASRWPTNRGWAERVKSIGEPELREMADNRER